MKQRFNKNQLPFLNQALSSSGSPRDLFWVAHNQVMRSESYSWQQDRILFAYERSAHAGDDWAMHALAMNILHDPVRFPEALSWLHHSVRAGNENAWKDVERQWDYIYHGIFTYNTHYEYDYPDLEVRCALMTDYILLRLGKDKWQDLDNETKETRIKMLCHEICILLDINNIEVEFSNILTYAENSRAQGLAYFGFDKIGMERSFLNDLQRVIQVVFHELGHHVVYYAMQRNNPHHLQLLKKYGLGEDHIEKWERNDSGYAITLTEEDPDTLSYGVWWTYLLYFGDRY